MARAKSVEKVQKRHSPLNRRKMRDTAQIHHLLHAVACEHRKAALATGIDVLMIAENGERLRRKRARRDMNDARKHLARDLIHIWNF